MLRRSTALLYSKSLTHYPTRGYVGSVRFQSGTAEEEANNLITEFKSEIENANQVITPRNFSFSGCGFLIPYHLGVAHALREMGYIQKSSKMAGASGGSIVAMAVVTAADLIEIKEDAKNLAAFGRAKGIWGNLEPTMRKLFEDRFAHFDVEQLTKRLTITTMQMWPKREIVHSNVFDSSKDLCDAIIASCWVPFYLARKPSSLFRGEWHIDGGLVKIVPEVPDHVRVCAIPADLLFRPDYEISPSLDPTFPIPSFDLIRYSLFPPEPRVLEDLFHHGRKTAYLWAKQQQKKEDKKN